MISASTAISSSTLGGLSTRYSTSGSRTSSISPSRGSAAIGSVAPARRAVHLIRSSSAAIRSPNGTAGGGGGAAGSGGPG